jgi:hypothetical protein
MLKMIQLEYKSLIYYSYSLIIRFETKIIHFETAFKGQLLNKF